MGEVEASPAKTVLVTGASGQIGDFLLPALSRAGYRVHAFGRKGGSAPAATRWFRGDLERPGELRAAAAGCAAMVHLAPLWLLPDHWPELSQAGVRRVVAFGSTSRFGKATSRDSREQAVVDRLKAAEASLCDAARRSGTDLFLLRPTLIYGSGRDRNVSSIARFIARFGFFPLAGDGRGLRQPVHAADLAKGVIVLLESELQGVRSYNLSGGETLTYRQMVERVFLAQGRRPRLLRLPEAPLRMGLRLLQMFPGFRHLSASMVDRMNRDLVYDHSEAARDFGYRPRPFYPEHLGRDGADPD